MSANAIWYEEKDRKFYFDGFAVRTEKLGRLLGNALVNGCRFIAFENGELRPSNERYGRDYKDAVTVNYVQSMLRFVAREGWFWDCLDQTIDHAFDNDCPTPGTRWAEAQELRRLARESFELAADLRRQGGKRNRELARLEKAEARDLMARASERQMPGISGQTRSR